MPRPIPASHQCSSPLPQFIFVSCRCIKCHVWPGEPTMLLCLEDLPRVVLLARCRTDHQVARRHPEGVLLSRRRPARR
jgi:hypothetical protein